MTTPKTSPKDQALAFKTLCLKYGWSFNASRDNVLEITKQIVPGCKQSFCNADMEYSSILDLAPLKGGSVWGTDGGGVGGMVAMRTGQFSIKKSGKAQSFMKELRKL